MKGDTVYVVDILKSIGSARTYIFLDVFENNDDAKNAGETACLPITEGGRGAYLYRIYKTMIK